MNKKVWIIVTLIVIGGVVSYFGLSDVKNEDLDMDNQDNVEVSVPTSASAPVPAVKDGVIPVNMEKEELNNQTENNFVISSILPSSGSVGTSVEIKGYNLLDNRGEQNLIIENEKGEFATLGFGDPEHLNISEKYVSMQFTLNEKVCKQWGTDKGGLCSGDSMNIIPGEYKIYVAHGDFSGVKTNKVLFTVTN